MPDPVEWVAWCQQHCDVLASTIGEFVDGSGHWTPSTQDQAFAWELYVELRTRISTQKLHFLSGDEASALDSLYRLFQVVRDLEKKHGSDAVVVASLTNVMLNGAIRPLTALWHKHKLEGKLHPEDLRHRFRRNLIDLQKTLLKFQKLLLRVACGDIADGTPQEQQLAGGQRNIPFGDTIPFNSLLGLSGTKHDAAAQLIIDAETMEISDRRAAVMQPADTGTDPAVDEQNICDLAGLAISGGGIRSATFALGVLQGLVQRGILKQVDLVSTVSGGGYLGSFLSTYLNTASPDVGPQKDRAPFRPDIARDSKAIRSLRNHSRYVQPASFLRWLTTLGQVLYGIVSNLIILSLWVFIAVLVTEYTIKPELQGYHSRVYSFVPRPLPKAAWSLNAVSQISLLVSGGMLFLLPVVQRVSRSLGRSQARVGYWELGTAVSFAASGLIVALDLLPNAHYGFMRVMRWVGETVLRGSSGSQGWSLTATFVAAGNTIGLLMARGEWIRNLARSFPIIGKGVFLLLWLCGPALVAYSYFELCRVYVAAPLPDLEFLNLRFPTACLFWMLALGTFIYSFMCNVNFTSLHRFYRNRLSETYLLRHVSDGEPQPVERPLLSELRKEPKSSAPYHLLNAALNLPSSQIDELRGRDCDFFLFSKHFTGSPVVGYHQTNAWEKADPHLDLGTAMAISGAAAAPQMGMGSIQGASFLMTLLNVRMGYWQRRPFDTDKLTAVRKFLGGPGPLYLAREALNRMHEQDRYLNLSDGGHVENLAIYELLRRRCRFIIAIDGEHDPSLVFPSLRQLQRFAMVDLGTSIDLRVDRLEWDQQPLPASLDQGEKQVEDAGAAQTKMTPRHIPYSRAHFAVGRIQYPAVTAEDTDAAQHAAPHADADTDRDNGNRTEPPAEQTCCRSAATGWLLYIKLSVTGNEPDYVADYRRQHPEFPHQTTNDQVFEEDQFEAYRCLGQHVAEDLFSTEILPAISEPPIEGWFRRLVDTVYQE